MAAIVAMQECVPLQDPVEGWSKNYGFWIRAGVLGGVVAVGISAFTMNMIPGVVLSKLQLTLLFVGQAIFYPFIGMLVAALWVFPIPFIILTIISLYVLLFAALFRIVAGKQIFSQMAKYPNEFILLVSFSASQSIMAVTYAAYGVLFEHMINTNFELPVILLLPVIKVIMKNLVSLPIAHMKDMVPEGVIFTVDFFNSMYLATCMQNTSSISTVATMMTLDFGQTAFALRGLHDRSDTILERLRQACGIVVDSDSLLPVIKVLCRNTDKFEQQTRRDVLLYSCLPHKLSQQARDLLDKLSLLPGNGVQSIPKFSISRVSELSTSFRASIGMSKMKWGLLLRNIAKIEPNNSIFVKAASSEAVQTIKADKSPAVQNLKILSETLEVLFTSECLLLTEYLESIIPLLYGSFIFLVVNLPSAPYHTDLIGLNHENVGGTLLNVYVYALLEFASFLMLALLMMRNCRMQALYHLAFVLETQMLLVQVKLMTWVLMTLSFRVVHFGADFSFKFAWMHDNNVR
ncbi:hypothetical protein V7S43_007139 [Phytophthora oleae]|uniref:Uncharacterized protein n=1 Tax=Phytophthora oleae TaxID=2107226 RepID=A0ABD3FPM2_9STRA